MFNMAKYLDIKKEDIWEHFRKK